MCLSRKTAAFRVPLKPIAVEKVPKFNPQFLSRLPAVAGGDCIRKKTGPQERGQTDRPVREAHTARLTLETVTLAAARAPFLKVQGVAANTPKA